MRTSDDMKTNESCVVKINVKKMSIFFRWNGNSNMNPNQILSLRVNTRLLRENADVVRILDRLTEDQIITTVSSLQMALL